MKGKTMSQDYWNDLYKKEETGWDIGYPSPPLKNYIDQLQDKGLAILIPGCGNAYEAQYLLDQGFARVTLIDIAPALTAALEFRFKADIGKRITILTGDFFTHEGKYDIILEQTFLSALDPSVRPQYVSKMHSLLNRGGVLAGVLFSKVFEEDGPPFGGTAEEYRAMFSEHFSVRKIEPCVNSIDRRLGNEVFIELLAK